MPRRNRKFKKRAGLEAKYNNEMITQLISRIMLGGKKCVAEKIVYTTLDNLSEKTGKPQVEAYEEAIKNVSPIMEVKSRRVGGSTYQVPVEVRKSRSTSLALRWIVSHARKRSGKGMIEKLTNELVDSFNNVGASIKKREDTHKMAEANKAFAHFKW